MTITLVVGPPGSGKSYNAVHYALGQARAGRQVFGNFTMKHPNFERITVEDLLDPLMPAGLVVLDEAHLWFPSRLSMKLPPSLLMKSSQTRKMGWDMLLIAQHESRLDKIWRDNANLIDVCKAWGPDGDPWFFTVTTYEPHNVRKAKKHCGRRTVPFLGRVAAAYDTTETLTVATHVTQQHDAYTNPAPPVDLAGFRKREAR